MNLIDALQPSAAEYATFTTYPFDPRFYRDYLSRELSSAGVSSPVLLMDYDRYQQNFDDGEWMPGSIAGDYYLEPVDVGSIFHPKLAVGTSEEEIHVAITSANLTLNEITSAAQLGTQYSVESDTAAENPYVPVVQDVLTFVDKLKETYVGRDAGTQLTRLLEAGSWVTDIDTDRPADTQFIQNLSEPIAEQLRTTLGNVDRLQLAAPFFGSPSALARIVSIISPKKCELIVDEGTSHIDLERAVDEIHCSTTVRRLEYPSSRWVHAKFMCFQGAGWSGCLHGSPNHTGEALLTTAADGNLEAGILRVEPDETYFFEESPLFESEAFSVTFSDCVDPSTVLTNSYTRVTDSDEDGTVTQDLRMTDVYVEADGDEELHIAVVMEQLTDGQLRNHECSITSLDGDRTASISWAERESTSAGGEEERIVGIATVSRNWKANIIRAELADGPVSNYRQITTEPAPYSTESNDMETTGGRDGMQTLIWNLIFKNDPQAGESLSQTATKIQSRLEDTEEAGSQIADDEDGDQGDDWTISGGGGRGGGSASQSAHKQLRDSLDLSLTNLRHLVEQDPDPAYAQEVIDHLENYWRAIEAGYVRAVISEDLFKNQGAIVDFDSDKLIDITQSKLAPLHTEHLFENIGEYLKTALEHAERPHEEYVDGDQAFECLFAHPAFVLGLDAATAGHGIHPYDFVRDIFKALSNSPPIIAENLLAPDAVTERYDAIVESYLEGLALLEEAYDCTLELPDSIENAHAVLLYVVWYQEIDEQETAVPLFQKIEPSERYDRSDLEELGQLMLLGRNNLNQYEKLSEFQSGSLRDIAMDIFSDKSGAGQDPEQQIESLAEGEYW